MGPDLVCSGQGGWASRGSSVQGQVIGIDAFVSVFCMSVQDGFHLAGCLAIGAAVGHAECERCAVGANDDVAGLSRLDCRVEVYGEAVHSFDYRHVFLPSALISMPRSVSSPNVSVIRCSLNGLGHISSILTWALSGFAGPTCRSKEGDDK